VDYFITSLNLKAILYNNSIVTYYTYGSGLKPLFCFSGYGQTGKDFAFIEPELQHEFTIVAINWFYTKNSIWNESRPINYDDLAEITTHILNKEQLKQKPSLCSFSIGVIPLLALAYSQPNYYNKIIIISAPGFAFFNLIKFSCNTGVGFRLFKLLINKSDFFYKLINSSIVRLILNKSKVKLLNHYISNKNALKIIQQTWLTYLTIMPAKRKLQLHLTYHLHYISGLKDKITPTRVFLKPLQKLIIQHYQTIYGHRLNNPENVKYIKQILLNS